VTEASAKGGKPEASQRSAAVMAGAATPASRGTSAASEQRSALTASVLWYGQQEQGKYALPSPSQCAARARIKKICVWNLKRRYRRSRPQEKLVQIPDHPLARRDRGHFKDVVKMPEGSNRKCERGFTTAFAFDRNFLTRPDNLHRWRYG
jgi:hypothetical protein